MVPRTYRDVGERNRVAGQAQATRCDNGALSQVAVRKPCARILVCCTSLSAIYLSIDRYHTRVAIMSMRARGDHQPQPATVSRTSRYELHRTRPIHGLVRVPHLRHSFTGRVTTNLEPGINLMLKRTDRACFQVNLSMNGQTFTFLPALDGAHFPTQINSNFLPGVEAICASLQRRLHAYVHLVVHG